MFNISRLKLQSDLLLIFVLIFFSVITYINILPNQLFYDDEELIYKNAYVQNLGFFQKYFTENMVAGAGKVSNMYRPVLLLSFAIDYRLWGNNHFGYHLTSIILHTANGILIFFLILKLFQRKTLSFLTSVLFLVHPIQTESIAYASGRTDPLCTFFSLLSILFFLHFLTIQKQKYFIYVASLFFFLLALFSKETAIILPALLFLVSMVKMNQKDVSFKKVTLMIVPFMLVTITYIVLRLTVLNFADTLNFYSSFNLSSNNSSYLYSHNLPIRLFTSTKIFFEYFHILIFPKDLIFSRDVQIITSFTNPWVFLFIFTVTILFYFSYINWRKNRLFIFSFFWFFIALFPSSGIIPINSIITEHYLYFPSLAFFLIVSFLLILLYQRFRRSAAQLILFILLFLYISLLSLRSMVRNQNWRDPITFYNISLKQSPWNIPMRHNLAMSYADIGKFETAVQEYKKIIEIADVYPNTHHNLANIYKEMGQYSQAEEEYEKALKMDPNFLFSYNGLIDLYRKTGEKEKLKNIETQIKNKQNQR